jgi:hypothetical protein
MHRGVNRNPGRVPLIGPSGIGTEIGDGQASPNVSRDGRNYYPGRNNCQHCHSGESRHPEQSWMPDQVRHDKREYVYLPE